MRVSELRVDRYGPLRPFSHRAFGRFVVVHGPNERGKTLLIDALIRLLFKKEIRRPRMFGTGQRNIGRVTEQPEGYVVLSDGQRELKLEADETLSAHFPVEITPADFRNVFVMRDSDLTVDDEHEYYEDIAEKITGLRSTQIEKVMQALQRRGRLRSATADAGLANNAETTPPKVADLVRRAETLIDRIQELASRLAGDGFDTRAQELLRLRLRREEIERRRDLYRRAERRREDNRAREALAELEEITRTLESLPAGTAEALERWHALAAESKHLDGDIEERRARRSQIEAERERAQELLGDLRVEERLAVERHRRLDSALRDDLDRYRRERQGLDLRRRHIVPLRAGLVAGLVSAGVLAAMWLATGSTVAAFAAGAGLVAAVMCGAGLLRIAGAGRALARHEEAMRAEAARHEVEAQTAGELEGAVREAETTAEALRRKVLDAASRLEANEAECDRTRRSIHSAEVRMRDIGAETKELALRTGCDTLDELARAVDDRRRLALEAAAREKLLQSLVPVPDGSNVREAWAREIQRRIEEDGGEELPVPDRAALASLDDEIVRVRGEESRLRDRQRAQTRLVTEIEVAAGALGVLEEPPRCRTTGELASLARSIGSWRDAVVAEQRVAQRAIAIVAGIEAEERQKVEDLFGEDTTVSRLFSRITDGRYARVGYESEEREVFVETPAGDRIPATSLSGGAFDQLYLAIRLSIAERLLGDGTAFFVLDDPFLKADTERLARLLEVLGRFAADGWQFLYFTAKDEVVSALRDEIHAGNVELIEMEPRPSRGRRRGAPAPPPLDEPVQRRMEL